MLGKRNLARNGRTRASLPHAPALPCSASAQQADGPVPRATRFCGQRRHPGRARQRRRPPWREPRLAEPARGPPSLQPPDPGGLLQRHEAAAPRRPAGARRRYLERIALTPRAVWFGRYTRPNFFAKVRNHLNCAQWMQPGSVPIMIVSAPPGQGVQRAVPRPAAWPRTSARKAWYRDFRRGGRQRPRDHRLRARLDRHDLVPRAGPPRRPAGTCCATAWTSCRSCPTPRSTSRARRPTGRARSYTARLLRYIGIDKVRGFMLNVTHFDWTQQQHRLRPQGVAAGGRQALRGRPPPTTAAAPCTTGPRNGKRINVFCNVRYRGAGPRPTTRTGLRQGGRLPVAQPARARPGAGSCNGAPRDGEWWLRRGADVRQVRDPADGARREAPATASSGGSRSAAWAPRVPTASTTPRSPERRCR